MLKEANKQAPVFTEDKILPLTSERKPSGLLDFSLFVVVFLLVIFIIALSVFSLVAQYANYGKGISAALAQPERLDHAIVLTYSRAWDFAVVKTSSLFLAFLLIFSGALYILRVIENKLSLSIDGTTRSGNLETSSPGLAMITLGVLLVVVTILNKSSVEYTVPTSLEQSTIQESNLEKSEN
jgi:hypothetical protein